MCEMAKSVEPTFCGMQCSGPNPERVKNLRAEAEARLMLASFYELERKEQLVFAAAFVELVTDRDTDK